MLGATLEARNIFNSRDVRENAMKCEKCDKTIGIFRIAGCWPTYISCKHCGQKYSIAHGHFIGLAYVFIAMPLMLFPFLVATYVGNEVQSVQTGALGIEPIAIIGPIVVYIASSVLYGSLLARKCTFTPRASFNFRKPAQE